MEDANLNPEDYLTNQEILQLRKLNKNINEVKTQEKQAATFFNLSLNEIANRWSKVMYELLNEINIVVGTNYNQDSTIEEIIYKIKELIKILVKEERSMYIGITILIIAIFLYLIDITE